MGEGEERVDMTLVRRVSWCSAGRSIVSCDQPSLDTRYFPSMTSLPTSPILTVCPSTDSARMLSYQELPTSSQLWRGHGPEAKRGSADGPRIMRNVKRWGRFSSRVRP